MSEPTTVASQWQEIESAPLKKQVLCFSFGKFYTATQLWPSYWVDNDANGEITPTQWQHLPAAPIES